MLECCKKTIYPLFLALILICLGMAVQYLPAEPADTNIKKSCEVFNDEFYYPVFGGRIDDNYTDATSLLICQSKPDAPGYKRFFSSPLYTTLDIDTIVDAANPIESLCDKNKPLYRVQYARYWHGYQTILRPLFYFTDYQGIRKINTFLQPLLFAFIIFLFWNYRLYELIAGWIVSYIILNPEAMAMNITYSIIYYLTAIYVILMLIFKDQIQRYISWPIFFMMMGISTNFFDWITYPTYALSIPLVVWFYLYPPDNFKTMIRDFILLSFCWCIGYAGMWLLRWVLATLLTDNNILADALDAMIHRGKSQVLNQEYPIGFAIYATYAELAIVHYEMKIIYCTLGLLVLAVLFCYKKSFKFAKERYFVFLPFIGAALAVPMYCLIVKGHPIQHAPYVYRMWAAFFFALISGLNFWVFKSLEKEKDKKCEQ